MKQTLTDDLVSFISMADLDDKNPDNYGLSGSATQVERIFPPETKEERKSLTGSAEEQTEAIYGLICDKKLI